MDALTSSFNAFASALLALMFGWAVLSPRVRDGVLIKVGLIMMTLGFAATAWVLSDGGACEDLRAVGRADALIHGGVLVVALGWALRTRVGRVKRRRSTDWGEFDDRANFGSEA